MRRDEAFPGKFLKAADVKETPLIAVISYVEKEKVGQGSDQKEKPVMYFQDADKPMVVNSTNWDTLAEAYGEDSDGWSGCKIKVYSAPTQYQGKRTEGLRVSAFKESNA